MLSILLSLILFAPQGEDKAALVRAAQEARNNRLGTEAETVLFTQGVEAPRQPTGASSSSVLRTDHGVGEPVRGAQGPIRVRIQELVSVRGQERNVVQGIGIVTGLAGTGDAAGAARQALLNMLKTQNIILNEQDVSSANVAVVLLQATLEPGIKPGQPIDVRVSSIYDCVSLVGGTLLHAELLDMTGRSVFATASGPVTTGAFSAGGDGAETVRNHLTVGTIPLGGKVQEEVPTRMVSEQGFVYLDLKSLKGSFANAERISDAINAIYPKAAVPRDAMTVSVEVPQDLPKNSIVAYLSSILQREIEPAPFARVVINERTGVIVMGEGVRITRGAITKGNITVTISENAETSQPGPFSDGTTTVLPRTSLLLEEENRPLTIVNGAVELQEVVEVLNIMGVTPRDMIQILQSMAQSGMLHAEILVM